MIQSLCGQLFLFIWKFYHTPQYYDITTTVLPHYYHYLKAMLALFSLFSAFCQYVLNCLYWYVYSFCVFDSLYLIV